MDLIPHPQPRISPKKYDFYEEFGHIIEEYLSFNFYLDSLAKQGHISQFMPAGTKQINTALRNKAVINMIVWDSQTLAPINGSEKVLSFNYSSDYNVISFSDVDY